MPTMNSHAPIFTDVLLFLLISPYSSSFKPESGLYMISLMTTAYLRGTAFGAPGVFVDMAYISGPPSGQRPLATLLDEPRKSITSITRSWFELIRKTVSPPANSSNPSWLWVYIKNPRAAIVVWSGMRNLFVSGVSVSQAPDMSTG